jgi:hypothetical protein
MDIHGQEPFSGFSSHNKDLEHIGIFLKRKPP